MKSLSFWVSSLLMALSMTSLAPHAGAVLLDLTTVGSSGTIGDGMFFQADPQPTGTGYINSFLRVQMNGSEQGYNTDGRLEFDEKKGNYTRSLRVDEVPVVNINGTNYREFILDINERHRGDDSLLSLDQLQIWLEGASDLTDYSTNFSNLIYDLDATADNWLLFDYSLNHGSGSGDMFAYIDDSLFAGPNDYVYLFSRFGDHNSSDAGFEEWAVREGGRDPVIPEPATVALMSMGLAGLGFIKRRRKALQS